MKKLKIIFLILALILISGYEFLDNNNETSLNYDGAYLDFEDIPEYSGENYVVLNDNIPYFDEEELEQDVFESYSPLDKYDRCGVAYAMLGEELMPTKERESIRDVKPTGWQTAAYEDLIRDTFLYNRSHLIAFSLAGENANMSNLITGTDYMNKEGMQPFELDVLEYIRETGNHVLYRVSPIFEEDELVARGVQMEAYSVEDSGEGICYNVYVYNVQPGIVIDYETGDNWRE